MIYRSHMSSICHCYPLVFPRCRLCFTGLTIPVWSLLTNLAHPQLKKWEKVNWIDGWLSLVNFTNERVCTQKSVTVNPWTLQNVENKTRWWGCTLHYNSVSSRNKLDSSENFLASMCFSQDTSYKTKSEVNDIHTDLNKFHFYHDRTRFVVSGQHFPANTRTTVSNDS
jgi:hypothetical protein